MESKTQRKRVADRRTFHFLRAVGITVLLVLAVSGTAVGQGAQEIHVTGTVTSREGSRLPGVTIRIRGTNTTTTTDSAGKYSLSAPADGVLLFNLIGFRGMGQPIGGRTSIDVALERLISVLPEVVVTGYTQQQRRDITGAVGLVNLESAARQTTASVLQRLDGRVSGVTVENSGSPGSRSTVRIRGVSSFQNNDPLYIIDGTPTQDSYLNWLAPEDIGSMQVLKDASSASIYGARASNGVVILESKKGRPGPRQVTVDIRTGVASPVRGYDDIVMTDALQYFQVVKASYLNAPGDSLHLFGQPVPGNIYGNDSLGNNPSIPQFIYPNNCGPKGKPGVCTNVDVSQYAWPGPGQKGTTLIMPGSAGTNWWKAVFGPAAITDAYVGIAGGGTDNAYNVSFNYYLQNGTAAYNRFQRGTTRVNTAFSVGRVQAGENIAFALEQAYGGLDDPGGYAEDGILGKNILLQPVIPVYDISGVHFASGKATNLGNQSNPLGYAWNRKDNRTTTGRLFGNVFAGIDLPHHFSAKTRFGFNVFQQTFKGYDPITPENSEPTIADRINQSYRTGTEWTWSNTVNYLGSVERHNLAVLLGQEANRVQSSRLDGNQANLLNPEPGSRYIGDPLGGSKAVNSFGDVGALLSFFGKADYNYAEKYYLSFTLRRDGSSRLGALHRWGTFPAIGAGWRLTQERFLASNGVISNAMLRFGWGVTGNQGIPTGRVVSQFGGDKGDVFYDITGSGSTILTGYRQTSVGNPDLKWEENRTVNGGLDLDLFNGKANFSLDVYNRETSNLLFPPARPSTAGRADPPFVNIGKMRNRGFEFSIGYTGNLGAGKLWSVTFNGSHYRNKIVQIDGTRTYFIGPISTRFGNQTIDSLGQPIGAFFGLKANGYFRDSAQIKALDAQTRACLAAKGTPDTTAIYQPGEAPGRIMFVPSPGSCQPDQQVIGSPHPDFTAGLDLGLRWGPWDVSATFFGSFGNKIFDVQKEFYVFRYSGANVRKDMLTESAVVQNGEVINPGAKYPRLDVTDQFSHAVSSYYLESGTYVRLRNLQVAYTVPPGLVRWIPAAKIYVQAENLFTLTGYPGLDPALPAANIFGPAGDLRDLYRGVDRGSYPSNRVINVGITTTF